MPDGSQQPPVNPDAQRAAEQMRHWKEQHRDPNTGGWLGNVVATVDELFAAAEAGQFAVSPDTGEAIIKQLTQVQDQVTEMRADGVMAGYMGAQRLGGGYATNIATFNQQVTEEGPSKALVQFAKELEQLKATISRSIANYGASDSANRRQIDTAGGDQ
ncbi:hypothetical protein [Actinocrispum wychmicini]|uniref:PE family protein n=1 Tax=Actinocrispum wychmicini TaxID=1213861 RepID=A0A4R2JI42_9PSEU|nr:hypothetical protein [Actinocrispum wychmicini]TCO58052.1 hypothetical protein EV192_105115 [Actinocrispum wychmicini]